MTVEPLKLGFDIKAFDEYCKHIGKMSWAPTGCVLHSTYLPTLKMVDQYISSGRYTMPQLIDNWFVSYKKQGWSAGPHIFVYRDLIYVATPLTQHGVHSPSYNSAYFGLELIGAYQTETLPPDIHANALHAFSSLYKIIGHNASPSNFRFHGEDLASSHRHCPGKNVGQKEGWIQAINMILNPTTPNNQS